MVPVILPYISLLCVFEFFSFAGSSEHHKDNAIIDVITVTTEVSQLDLYAGVIVRKCCGKEEVATESQESSAYCRHISSDRNETHHPWSPLFSDNDGNPNFRVKEKDFHIINGKPECKKERSWPIYHYPNSPDDLLLFANGTLKHTIFNNVNENKRSTGVSFFYSPNNYCLDNIIIQQNSQSHAPNITQYAILCVPSVEEFDVFNFVHNLIYPAFLSLSILCLLIAIILHIVVPQLRDLIGSITISICVSYLLSYIIHMILIFGQANPHINILVTEVIMYASTLAAFFWLNAMGYHIWKIVRARSMFIRVTDRRKYCYYSCYVWGSTAIMTCLAVASHFLLDTTKMSPHTPETWFRIGWIGIAMFYSPVAFLILVNILFYVTTMHILIKRAPLGRILQQMKFNFELYVKLSIVMTLTWLFQVLAWVEFESLLYISMTFKVLHGPFFFAITLCRRRVKLLLRQHFCTEKCKCICCCCCEDDLNDQQTRNEMLSLGTYTV